MLKKILALLLLPVYYVLLVVALILVVPLAAIDSLLDESFGTWARPIE